MKTSAGQEPRLVTIAVPAKDEEAAIGELLTSLPRDELRAMGLDIEVFLLDGNSRDATPEIARRHGATVLSDPEPGKGSAMRYARRHFNGDFVVMLDADGTYPPSAIPHLLRPILDGDADIVMGNRNARPDAMSRLHRVGNNLLSLAASVLYARSCPDVCTGMWAFRKEVLQSLPLRCNGFELEAEMFSLASRLDHRIVHIEVDYLPRLGESKLSTLHGFSIGWHLLRSRFMPVPRGTEVTAKAPTGLDVRAVPVEARR